MHVFYLDNVMHQGGSGGPVVDTDGILLGIVSKRAVIELTEEDAVRGKISSGSGMAVTAEAILQYARMQDNQLSGLKLNDPSCD